MSNSNQNYLYKYISEQTASGSSDKKKIEYFKAWYDGGLTQAQLEVLWNALDADEQKTWNKLVKSGFKLPNRYELALEDFKSKILDSGVNKAPAPAAKQPAEQGAADDAKKIELFKAWFSSPIGPGKKAVWKKFHASLTDGEKARFRDRIIWVSPEGNSEKDAVNFFTSRVLDSGKGIGKQAELLTLTNAFVMPGIRYRNSRVDNSRVSIPLAFTREKTSAQARKEGENFESFTMNNDIKLRYSTIDQSSNVSKRDPTGIAITISGVNLKTNINKSFVFSGEKDNDNIKSVHISRGTSENSLILKVFFKQIIAGVDIDPEVDYIDGSAPLRLSFKYPNPKGKTLDGLGQVDMKNDGSDFVANSTNANTQAQTKDKGELKIGLPDEKLTRIQNNVTSKYTNTNKPLVKLVSELQYYLHENGYTTVNQDRFVDGVFGPGTLTALVKAANSFLPEPEQLKESVGVSNLRSKLRSRKDIEKDAERLYKSLTGLGSGGALKILKKYLGDGGSGRNGYWDHTYGTKENPKNRKGDEEVILLYWQYSKILNRNRKTSSGDLINWMLDESSKGVRYYGKLLLFILKVHNVNRTWAGIDLKDNISAKIEKATEDALKPSVLSRVGAYELVKRMGKTPPFGKPKKNVAKMGSRAVNKIRKFSQVLTRGARKSIEQQSGWTIKVKKYKSGKFVAMMKREDMKSGSDRLNKYFSNKTTGPFADDIDKAIATLTSLSDAERRNVRKTFSGASARSMAEFQIIARGKKIGILLPGYLFADSQTQKYVDNGEKTKSSEKSADKAKTQNNKKAASKPNMAKPENFIPRYIGRIKANLQTMRNQPSAGGVFSNKIQQIINKLKNKNDPRAKNIVEVSKLLLEVYKRRKK